MEVTINQIKNITGVEFGILKYDLFNEHISENKIIIEENDIIGIITNLPDISFLKDYPFLKLISIINCAENIQILKKLKNLEELHITESKISNLDFLGEYKNLQNLSIKRCGLKDISQCKNLKSLKSLNFRGNEIVDISPIKSLTKLEELTLWDNKISNISFLSSLTNLNYLDLDDNDISEISTLSKLKSIRTLYLSSNKVSLIQPLCNIDNLRRLDVSYNLITDTENINKISNLVELNITKCNISDLSVVKGLNSLKILIANSNNIYNIPTDIFSPLITELHLAHNKLDDLTNLTDLQGLTKLHIDDNFITDLTPLIPLSKLIQLGLNNNNIKDIRPLITLIENGLPVNKGDDNYRGIFIEENPLEYPSYQTIRHGNSAILRFFKKIDAEGEGIIYEAKLTFVGEGSAGKTSLMRRLINSKAEFPQEKNRTRGISIEDWEFKKLKNKKHVAHIWDFGGQDVYYPVHRFFLTENSVFVLLASSRQNTHHFDYWIPTIYQFGGRSPIIIGQTCHDGHIANWNDIGDYIGNENFNIIKDHSKYYHELNLPKGNKGLAQIKKSIIAQITNLPHYKKNVPKSWISVRDLLNKIKSQNCISYIDLKTKIIQSNSDSFKTKEDIEDCISFFHSIGVVLWYQNESQLESWVILNPKWAVDAVYKIIDFKKNINNGIILSEDFDKVWKAKIYDDKHGILKNMLEVFKIAFPKKSNKRDYIMPTRLESIEPHNIWSDIDSTLKVEYLYDFMPKGLVNQISAELSRFVNDNEIWNNAVNLHASNATGQIFEDFFKRKIVITTQGDDSRGLMSIIMNAIKDITDGYKGVIPKIVIPCPCEKCINKNDPTIFSYDMLLDKLKENTEARVYCNISDQRFSVETLLYNIGISPLKKTSNLSDKKEIKLKKTIKIFLASSNELKNERDAFSNFLREENDQLIKRGLYLNLVNWENFLDDISTTRKQDDYNKALGDCDIAVCLFFSKVGKFTEEEFDTAYQKFSSTGKPRIWTYFKDASISSANIDNSIKTLLEFKEKLSELGHFHTTFDSNSDLHLKFRRQIDHLIDEINY
ncbi:COR domain-containing protein [Chryseobacterium sp. JUb7]|uniref:COR domain-containing protein n=1 Tax=Chryseobacterium sp. JUb7 TaxID=2940599 RepID=UPI0021690495|nr:COR domain-containing protein [Chryseobacterium sp. JUb7]MCS3528655.1 Leucine-rich repeat (LRR) protein [Chryseobacterium sp. JUb7]